MNLVAYLLGHFTQYSVFLSIFSFLCLIFFSKNTIFNIIYFFIAIFISQAHQAHIKPQRNVYHQVLLKPSKSRVLSFTQKKGRLKQYRLSFQHQIIELICWNHCPTMYPGELWQWQGKIKPIQTYHNFNDQSFWYEPKNRHLLGRVFIDGQNLKRIATIQTHDWINVIRKKIYLAVDAYFSKKETHFARALFLTLVLGLGSELDNSEWALFKNTGIVHLMVVSGAHFNLLLTLLMHLLGMIYWMLPILALFIPRQVFIATLALILGLIYAAISGFGIPMQRAWLMSFIRFFPYFSLPKYSVWQGMRFSVYIILAIEPHAIFYPGAYLSFLAIIALIMAEEITNKIRKIRIILSQVICNIVMIPLCLLWFSQFPLVALLVNLFAIPWVSYVFLPIVFLNSVLFLLKVPPIMLDFFQLNSKLFQVTLDLLQQHTLATFHHYGLSSIDAFALFGGILMYLMMPLWRFRLIAIFLCMLSLSSERKFLNKGEFQADIIDVGQGLAILLQTKHHHILYDLGPKQAAFHALFPYLLKGKNSALDGIVLSHHDMDHIGGLDVILEHYPNIAMIVDNAHQYSNFKQKKINCHRLSDWQWDGVQFSFLKYANPAATKNNRSCVLKISNQKYSLLLPGDIEANAESRLFKLYGAKLRANVLILAHHGSHSSSTKDFIKAISPQLGVISYGQFNHYGHPHQDIIARFKSLHIPLLSTAVDGGIKIFFLEKSWYFQTYYTSYWHYLSHVVHLLKK